MQDNENQSIQSLSPTVWPHYTLLDNHCNIEGVAEERQQYLLYKLWSFLIFIAGSENMKFNT